MPELNTAVAICDSHSRAERTRRVFQGSGVATRTLSIEGKHQGTEAQVIGVNSTGGPIRFWGKSNVVVAHGTRAGVTTAMRILEEPRALSVDEHDAPGAV